MRTRVRMVLGMGAAASMLAASGCYDPQTKHDLAARMLVKNVRLGTPSVTNELRVALDAGDVAPELKLTPNTSILAPDAKFIFGDQELTLEQAGVRLPFKGSVEGDPDSWVRVNVHDGKVEGMMFMHDQLWELRKSDGDGELWLNQVAIDEFIDNPTHQKRTCASVETAAAQAGPGEAASPTSPQAASATCKQLDMALVADHTYVEELGGSQEAANEMLKRINESDGLFRSDLNYGFKITSVQTLPNAGGPSFNSTSSGPLPLEAFSDFKEQNFPDAGLAHLFVARTTSGAVGVAWVGATCTSFGAGVSSYLGSGKSSTIVVAHEIGHNFGSSHDSANSQFVMRPSVNPSATTFSNSSHAQIDQHVASRSCFVPCESTTPEIPDDGDDEEPTTPDDTAGDGDGGQPTGGSCEGFCGEQSQDGCWCDGACVTHGDCCSDVGVCDGGSQPEPVSACEGFCGKQSPQGCWCDNACAQYGDCCEGKSATCG